MGRPKIYEKTIVVSASVPARLHKLAEELHIGWSTAIRTGIKLLANGGDEPVLPEEIVNKHLKIEEEMGNIIERREDEIERLNQKITKLSSR